MNLSKSGILITVALITLLLCSCGTKSTGDGGFNISLVESGELILTDDHIATYIWGKHRIILTPEGTERWDSFVKFDGSHTPPARKLGSLTSKEFVVTLGDVEMYRGHFSSMASSLMQPGVLLYDTLGIPQGELWFEITRLEGEPMDDPRDRPEIAEHFRKLGKLKENI